jgi:hypothetical protein
MLYSLVVRSYFFRVLCLYCGQVYGGLLFGPWLEIAYGLDVIDLRVREELMPLAEAAVRGSPVVLTEAQGAALRWLGVQHSLVYGPLHGLHLRFEALARWLRQEEHGWGLMVEHLCEPSNSLLLSQMALLWALRQLRKHWRTLTREELKREFPLACICLLLLALLALMG